MGQVAVGEVEPQFGAAVVTVDEAEIDGLAHQAAVADDLFEPFADGGAAHEEIADDGDGAGLGPLADVEAQVGVVGEAFRLMP